MNQEELGELFLVGFPDGIDDEAIALMKRVRPGGIIIYPGNMKDSHELEITMDILYEFMRREGIQLFISSDHEGGQLETVPGIMPSPGNMALGRLEKGYTASYGKYLGRTLKGLGFNTLFAPVVDVSHETSSPVTGFRAFSREPEKVGEHGEAFISALQREGIIATAKHFPGHGKANADSHKVLPKVEEFDDEDPDILPFKRAIDAGVGMIMTAHIVYPNIDTEPATLSKKILKGILREKLGYNNIIISDAIEMQALYDNYSIRDMVYKFFNATGDIFLVANGKKNLNLSYEALVSQIEEGKIDRELIEESINRIKRIKEKYIEDTYPNLFILDIARKAQYVHMKEKVKGDTLFLIPHATALSPADTTNLDIRKYEDIIRLLYPNPRIVRYDIFTGNTDNIIPNTDNIVAGAIDSFRFEGQKRLFASLPNKAKRVIYLILRDPKDEELYKDEEYIITYSTKPLSFYQALRRVIKGE